MNKKEFRAMLRTAVVYRDDTEEKKVKIINPALPEDVNEKLRDLLVDGVSFDTSYEILEDACLAYSELSEDESAEDATGGEWCSHYTSDRLNVITHWNQQEISDIIKECMFNNISDAAAYWYDSKVEETLFALEGIENEMEETESDENE